MPDPRSHSTDPHTGTLEVYETRATDWERRRPPELRRSQAFSALCAARSLPNGATIDLGCGPGWHLPTLPAGTIACDGAAAMLDLVPGHSPTSTRLQSDLRALPFAPRSLRAVWANKSYVHLDRRRTPLALWDLHRSIAVDGLAEFGLFGGDADHTEFGGDHFSGRSFSLWPESLLIDVMTGAGFGVESITSHESSTAGDWPFIHLRARRLRTLADTVGPNMRLLLVGLNPSLHAADSGVGFSGANNRGWPALLASGLATVDRDPIALLRDGRVGMTDLVKCATARADELEPQEFRDGIGRLDRLCAWLQPGAICVIGITGWRHAVHRKATVGLQSESLGGRPVWVMPNPSGLNAHTNFAELTENLLEAARLADT